MDPVTTTLVTAFVAGAVKGVTKVGEQTVVDAYGALKHMVTVAYGKAGDLLNSIAQLEAKPDSQGRRATLAEELEAAEAVDDERLLALAEAVLDAAQGTQQTIGVDWTDVKAARVRIGEIRARAGSIGFRAARLEITDELSIDKIDVGGPSGN
jgi:hypothetical protein